MTDPADTTTLTKGDTLTLEVLRPAHGGEGIAHHDGRVIFVRGGFPGDEAEVEITAVKKNWARGHVTALTRASADRVPGRCPAAAAGAGCCDFAELNPAAELGLKARVLSDQLERIGGLQTVPELELIDLPPHTGWRTRVRLGVDAGGRAGFRRQKSNELVTEVACSQVDPALIDGLVGAGARRFTPHAEVIAAIDDRGERHIIESRKAPRGRRTETVLKVLEGSGTVHQQVGEYTWEFSATAFWQGHRAAPAAYSRFIAEVLEKAQLAAPEQGAPVAWDLYGGVGLFAPVIVDKLGAQVHSVELSTGSAESGEAALAGLPVTFHTGTVESFIPQLPAPQVVVLDPPRTGAGAEVIGDIVTAQPDLVIHIGCDPATFARDVADWRTGGYTLERLAVFNSFPGTHHMETIGVFRRETQVS